MSRENYLGPVDAAGSSYVERLSLGGYQGGAVDFVIPETLEQSSSQVLESQCAVILDPDLSSFGVGAFGDGWVLLIGQ